MIELVICNNDNMAEGAIAALNEYGYNTGVEGSVTIPVFGVDATEYARQLIASGRMTGTIVQDAEKMAEIISHLAVNASQGKDLMEDVFSSFPGTESGIRNKVIIPYSFYDPQEEEPGAPDGEPGAPGADD
jgi:methyl-galactoside transport system substrate-binding protein